MPDNDRELVAIFYFPAFVDAAGIIQGLVHSNKFSSFEHPRGWIML